MNRLFISCLLIASMCGCEMTRSGDAGAGADAEGGGSGAARTAAAAAAAAAAEGGQHRHDLFTPEQIKWKPGPASLPRGAEMAVLEGDPSKKGFFAMRIRVPDGYRIPPHWHPNYERVTVIRGTFHLGHGEKFEPAAAQRMPAGSYTTMSPGMRHFAYVEGATELQLATIGPWEIHYVNPADDPRKAGKAAGADAR